MNLCHRFWAFSSLFPCYYFIQFVHVIINSFNNVLMICFEEPVFKTILTDISWVMNYYMTRPCLRHYTIDKAVRDLMIIAILFYSGFDLLKLIPKIKVIAYRLSIWNIWTWKLWFHSYDSCEENILDRVRIKGSLS